MEQNSETKLLYLCVACPQWMSRRGAGARLGEGCSTLFSEYIYEQFFHSVLTKSVPVFIDLETRVVHRRQLRWCVFLLISMILLYIEI